MNKLALMHGYILSLGWQEDRLTDDYRMLLILVIVAGTLVGLCVIWIRRYLKGHVSSIQECATEPSKQLTGPIAFLRSALIVFTAGYLGFRYLAPVVMNDKLVEIRPIHFAVLQWSVVVFAALAAWPASVRRGSRNIVAPTVMGTLIGAIGMMTWAFNLLDSPGFSANLMVMVSLIGGIMGFIISLLASLYATLLSFLFDKTVGLAHVE